MKSDVFTSIDTPEIWDYKVVDGELVYSPPLVDFETAKLDKIQQLNQNANELRDEFLDKYPTLEIETFEKKEREANEFVRDNNAPVPFLTALVHGDRGRLPALCEAILAKSALSAQQEAYIVGLRDAIKRCSTKEELDDINVELSR